MVSGITLDLEYLTLSDDDLRRIYKFVFASPEQPHFLRAFAEAFLTAFDDQDFKLMRNVAITFVAKYHLGCYLVSDLGVERRG